MDVAIVGGGLSGLAAAISAARAGASVAVLEARGSLGGRAATDELGGFALLRGPHALYGGGHGERVLRELGAWPAGRRAPSQHHRLLRRGRLEPAPYDLEGAAALPASSAFASITGARPECDRACTAAQWIEDVTSDAAEREFLRTFLRTTSYTSALTKLPARIAIDQAQRAIHPGVRYLHGGWQPMIDALGQQAKRVGVRVICRARVDALLESGGAHVVDGESVHARSVVLAGLAPTAARRLLETAGGQHPVTEPRPVTAACLDVALRRLPHEDRRFVMGVDEPVLLTDVTRAALGCPPPGGAVLHVARYLRDGGDSAERATLEDVLELVQPGWRQEVVHARFLPRMTVVEHMGPRPPADATGVDWAILAGDWVGDEGWLSEASLASGEDAGNRAARIAIDGRRPVAPAGGGSGGPRP